MSTLRRHARRWIPSTVILSRIRPLAWLLDALDRVTSWPWRELRNLPPNRFRIRVGVGNRLLFNQLMHVTYGMDQVVNMFALGVMDSDSNVVELGSGCGKFAMGLQRASSFRGSYLGIDVDGEMVDWCRTHIAGDRFRFEHSDVEHALYNPGNDGGNGHYVIPVEPSSQDAVIAHSVATHLLEEDLRHYLAESARVLRDGGRLCMTVFCIEDMRELGFLGDRWTMDHRVGIAYVESARHPEAAVAYEREALTAMAREAGLDEVDFRRQQGSFGAQTVLIARA
jgi:ubiquinone/menaquinone biosynthesis C-methylase UbiE